MNFTKSLEQNIRSIKEKLNSEDVLYHEIKVGENNATLIIVDGMNDKEWINTQIIRPLKIYNGELDANEILKVIGCADCESVKGRLDGENAVLSGNALLLIDGVDSGIKIGVRVCPQRAIAEPPTSVVLKGPREGFVEDFKTNIVLLRKRIKSADLKVCTIEVGKYSKTSVSVVYIDSIANDEIVKQIKNKLKKISIDGVADSSIIGNFLSSNKFSLFNQYGTTEKPDVLASKLLEGRVGIIVDGSPIVLTVPYLLLEEFQGSEDYYKHSSRANFSRILRFMAVAFCVFLPAFYVSAQLFHLELIPLNFLITVVNSIKGLPFTPSFEMLFTLLIFEVLNEASIRMPKYVGMALSVVGALVLGETAVSAGIISTPTVLIMALSGIAMYTLPDMADSLSVLRLIFLVLAGTLGIYALICALCFLMIYLINLSSYSVPVLAPISPLVPGDLKDSLIKEPNYFLTKRPVSLKTKNLTRMRHNIKGEKNESKR